MVSLKMQRFFYRLSFIGWDGERRKPVRYEEPPQMEPMMGHDPTTSELQILCYYPLSYIGVRKAALVPVV